MVSHSNHFLICTFDSVAHLLCCIQLNPTFLLLHTCICSQVQSGRKKKKHAKLISVSFLFSYFWLHWLGCVVLRLSHPAAYGTLVPWPGIELMSPALAGRFLTTGPLGNFLNLDSRPRTSDVLLILPDSHTSLIHSLSHHSR